VGAEASSPLTPGRPAWVLEANVDDATPEVLAHALGALLDAGAHDAWITPIVMKKSRPAHTVHALCDDAVRARVLEVLVRETGTLGVRASTVERWPQRRHHSTVVVDGHRIGVKVGEHRVKVEFDDAARAATLTGRPLREMLAAAEEAARHQADQPGSLASADATHDS